LAVGIGYVVTNLIQVVQGYMLSRSNPYDRSVVHAAVAAIASLAVGAVALWATRALGPWPSRVLAAVVICVLLWQLGWRSRSRARAAT
jgi:hypothetical protein